MCVSTTRIIGCVILIFYYCGASGGATRREVPGSIPGGGPRKFSSDQIVVFAFSNPGVHSAGNRNNKYQEIFFGVKEGTALRADSFAECQSKDGSPTFRPPFCFRDLLQNVLHIVLYYDLSVVHTFVCFFPSRSCVVLPFVLRIQFYSFKRTYERWGLKDGEGKLRIETSGGE
jgi:hypothetical protein